MKNKKASNLQSYKKKIIDFLKQCKKYGSFSDGETMVFYDMLTENKKNIDQKQNESIINNQQICNKYEREIKSLLPINNQNTWREYRTNDDYPKEQEDEITYTIYYTLNFSQIKDIENYLKFVKELKCKFQTLSEKEEKTIAFKTFNTIEKLLTKNDTIKFYYYDKSIKNKIENVIKNLMYQNHIKQGTRMYKDGIDKGDYSHEEFNKFFSDSKNELIPQGSFGVILSKEIGEKICKLVNNVWKNKDQQTLADIIINRWEELVKNVLGEMKRKPKYMKYINSNKRIKQNIKIAKQLIKLAKELSS